jgi:hypothetical protein
MTEMALNLLPLSKYPFSSLSFQLIFAGSSHMDITRVIHFIFICCGQSMRRNWQSECSNAAVEHFTATAYNFIQEERTFLFSTRLTLSTFVLLKSMLRVHEPFVL